MKRTATLLIDEPVQPGDFQNVVPEFGRTRDVERHFGLKRGTLYNLHAQNRVRGHLLRVAGEKSGVRVWDMESVRACIRSCSDFGSPDEAARPVRQHKAGQHNKQ